MRLKEFLKLIRTDEIINIYNPIENRYYQCEKDKENIDETYWDYKVVGIETTYDDFYNSVLELHISNT